tara:strand:+ start:2288 stop:2539 length:252 start_codon:yes stop_codon:yes gene_type:complete
MKMTEEEIHLIHEVWEVVLSYISTKEAELVCEELLEKFETAGFVIEDNIKELKGTDKVIDDVIDNMYYIEEEEEVEEPEVYDY